MEVARTLAYFFLRITKLQATLRCSNAEIVISLVSSAHARLISATPSCIAAPAQMILNSLPRAREIEQHWRA